MEYVLSFDVGTSTLKAILVNTVGHIVKSANATYSAKMPSDGFVEQDPDEWWQAIVKTTHEVMNGSGVKPSLVKGLVFSTQAAGVIPIGQDNGRILYPAIIWLDSRASEEAIEMMDIIGGPEVCEELVGARLTGKDSLPKVRWLYKNRPDVFEKMDCFLDVNGYLIYRATGEKVFDIASASCVAYDPSRDGMADELLALSGFDPAKFPRIVKSYDAVGNLTEKAAMELGLTTETKVFGGTNDMQSTAIGSGMTGEEEVHFCLGTSGWVVALTKRMEALTNGGACIQSAEPHVNLWFYSTETACATLNWFIDNFFEAEKKDPTIRNIYEHADKLIENIPAGSDYLVFNPWMCGERCPISDVYVRGGFLNLGLSHTRSHMLRAVYEGIAYNLKWACESLENNLGHKIPTVRILGGGTKSKLWMRIFADVFNRPVEIVRDTQMAGAIGAACIAALGLGIFSNFEDSKQWARVESVYYPNPENVPVYEELYDVFKASYGGLKDFYCNVNKGRILD